MPELPDVEGFRRIADAAVGARIETVEAADPGVLRNVAPKALSGALAGQRLKPPERRGKWLILPTSGASLLFHFGMTGALEWQVDPTEDHPHDRVTVRTDAGRLVYRDQRKLQGVWLAVDAGKVDEIIGELGPDALGISARALDKALSGRRRALKAALMDQEVIAGLGNLTVDEILWHARLNPKDRYDNLDAGRRRSLHRAVAAVLRPAVKVGSVPERRGWLTSQRNRPEPLCPRCGKRLTELRVGGRRSLICPDCQSCSGPRGK